MRFTTGEGGSSNPPLIYNLQHYRFVRLEKWTDVMLL